MFDEDDEPPKYVGYSHCGEVMKLVFPAMLFWTFMNLGGLALILKFVR